MYLTCLQPNKQNKIEENESVTTSIEKQNRPFRTATLLKGIPQSNRNSSNDNKMIEVFYQRLLPATCRAWAGTATK